MPRCGLVLEVPQRSRQLRAPDTKNESDCMLPADARGKISEQIYEKRRYKRWEDRSNRPGWIVFAVYGLNATGPLGWRLCWVIADAYELVHMSDGKVAGGFPSPMMVKVFIPRGVAVYLLFHSFNGTEGRDSLSFGYLLSKFSKVLVRFAPYKRTLSVQFKIISEQIFIRSTMINYTDKAAIYENCHYKLLVLL